MNIIAWISIVLVSVKALIYPSLVGLERDNFSTSGVVRAYTEAVLVILLALRVLGKI